MIQTCTCSSINIRCPNTLNLLFDKSKYVKISIILKWVNIFFFFQYLTLGSNFKEDAVSKAARPSFKIIPKPPTNGEYSMSTI